MEGNIFSKRRSSTKVDSSIPRVELLLKYIGDDRFNCLFWVDGYLQTKGQETVVVSGAAGAVGIVVGQIAKLQGCRRGHSRYG
jgi:NADPH-dependent curcumin reductase CurA